MVDGEPVSDSHRRPGRVMQDYGYVFASSKGWRECFADALANKFDPASNLRDMDREGIDVSVLFPTLGLYIMWRDNIDPELSAAICRAYNTWLSDYCSYDRKRLHGVILVPLQDPARAVAELKHAREKLGLVGIFWRPNRLCGRNFSSPDYFPIYQAASDLGVTVCIHGGARTVLAQAGSVQMLRRTPPHPSGATGCARGAPPREQRRQRFLPRPPSLTECEEPMLAGFAAEGVDAHGT